MQVFFIDATNAANAEHIFQKPWLISSGRDHVVLDLDNDGNSRGLCVFFFCFWLADRFHV